MVLELTHVVMYGKKVLRNLRVKATVLRESQDIRGLGY